MDDEIDHRPAPRQLGEAAVERGHVAHVAIDQERAVGTAPAFAEQGLGERTHALFHHLALIAEGEFGAGLMQRLGDSPGQRLVVREPHDEAALAAHQFSQGSSLPVEIVAPYALILGFG